MENKIQNNQSFKNSIFKDYTEKIKGKIIDIGDKTQIKPDDFNNMIIFLNWCFHEKNNFFVEDFNKKQIKNICSVYNSLKTNIFSEDCPHIFHQISLPQIKSLKFILYNYIMNFEKINTGNNKELCSKVSKISIIKCLGEINKHMMMLENV